MSRFLNVDCGQSRYRRELSIGEKPLDDKQRLRWYFILAPILVLWGLVIVSAAHSSPPVIAFMSDEALAAERLRLIQLDAIQTVYDNQRLLDIQREIRKRNQ